MKQHTEEAFEAAIENHLLTVGGYIKAAPDNFDRVRCLDTDLLLSFIKETQPKEWAYLEKIQKAKAAETLLDDLCRALDSEHEGALGVLRHGFKCFGKLFKAAYFAPASGLNPETIARYDANKLSITRQLKYSDKHENSLDVVLGLNGIPVATLELKNPMTGQTWKSAVRQYKKDRDQSELIFSFKKRTLVHFAVDPDEAYMTTKLKGDSTYFLPFNRGRDNGAGNPPNPGGYKTAYLWEQVLSRQSWLDILARFIHLQTDEKEIVGKKIRTETMIFPRYHQLDAVRRLRWDAREHGAGHNYLIQHSAGSGKSNSIAWLAHQLASLHDDHDNKVYDSVVVITDRIVLDKQLQDAIFQFEHKQGVVEKIDKDATQLADALAAGTPIVITTLQKFPFITEKIGELPKRDYAVIIDEAHSSQGGESATEVKSVLSAAVIREAAEQYIAEEGELPDHEEEILRTIAKRGRQPNISFFAFTATPKYRTLEVFGRPGRDGKPEPFHLYSMRQAIEERFILDVLKNYTTYKAYYGLIKSIEDDPEVDKKKAARALARFMTLHPHNIAQKTEVIIEHFRHFTRHKIGGKAKAMVVTSSRLHAVRYKLAFDKYITEKRYDDIKALVAFSGKVTDPATNIEYSEVGMNNGIKEKELPKRFASPEYQVLIVAEKYQTGFDQPLLHTMYVDKRLAGVQAVQTLSRLNRTHPNKEETFVLDFVNNPEEILAAFQPYYEATLIGKRAEVSQLYELQAKLDARQVYFKSEVEEFSRIFYRPRRTQTKADHAGLNACIDPAVERFKALDEPEREEFRRALIAYRNLYSFLSQIIPFQDSDLEKLYSYIRFLVTKLPKLDTEPNYHLDDDVALKYYRLQKISEGSIELEKGAGGEVSGPTEVGTGQERGEKIELSQLIDILNERFGTEFTEADQLFFDSIRADAVADEKLRQAALANTMENFSYVFLKALEGLFIDRIEQNEEIAAKFMNESDFRNAVSQTLLRQVYEQIRASA